MKTCNMLTIEKTSNKIVVTITNESGFHITNENELDDFIREVSRKAKRFMINNLETK